MIQTWLEWAVLGAVATTAFLIDRRGHRGCQGGLSAKQSAIETAVWTAIGLSFGLVVWLLRDGHAATQYVTGYSLEKSLSLDNVAAFAVIITSLGIAQAQQRRLVDHAIIGALALRLLFIAGGLALLEHVHAILYVFGAFLVVSGVRMAQAGHEQSSGASHERPRVVALAGRFMPIVATADTDRYVTTRPGTDKRGATTLLVALTALALVDVVFAVDSIPAIFSVSHNAWIVVAANAFALLGMRPMYFLLADGIRRFAHLQHGLAVILVGIGIDLLIEDFVTVPTIATLGFVVLVLAVSIYASRRREMAEEGDRRVALEGAVEDPARPPVASGLR